MIKPAQITWSDDTPISTEFDDVYFSKASGLDETRYVFIKQNHLPERWANHPASQFTIAETGFGTGLNFLCAWQQWLEQSRKGQTMHFVSVEKFPLKKADLITALEKWPELSPLAKTLCDYYPELVSGWHSIHLPTPTELQDSSTGEVVLHLYFGDIHDWLSETTAQIDAWFLDGFAPAKNPEMWQPKLFSQMARLSHANTTVATFTAAGLVKRGLKGAGFKVKKAKGFGKKRDMIVADYQSTIGPVLPNYVCQSPWLCIPQNEAEKDVIIVGAGIAGCSTAYSLAQRGYKVKLLEKKEDIANGGSGNAQGVIYAKLPVQFTTQSDFYLSGYLYSLRTLKQTLGEPKRINSQQQWDDCGVLQLALNEKEQQRQIKFENNHDLQSIIARVSAEQASELAGIKLKHDGLWFKNGAWVYPKAWCEALIKHENISLITKCTVENIQYCDAQWQVQCSIDKEAKAFNSSNLVICSAYEAKKLDALSFLPTKAMAGQVSQAKQHSLTLNTVLCGDSYVTPMHDGKVNFGASYRVNSTATEIRAEDTDHNLKSLMDNFPTVAEQVDVALGGRASVRCSTPDYTPIVGAVCEPESFFTDFEPLRKNKKWRFRQPSKFYQNLYLNLGHGSRGLSTAPLCAELVAAQMNNEPWPLKTSTAEILSPNRFLVNQL